MSNFVEDFRNAVTLQDWSLTSRAERAGYHE